MPSIIPSLLPLNPLVISKVIRWIIRPETIDADALLHPPAPWDLLVIVPGSNPLPPQIQSQLSAHWSTSTGVPSRLTKDFARTNASLLHPAPSSVPELTGSLSSPRFGKTAQTLELSPDLHEWIKSFATTSPGRSAVSMLNLLAFKPGMHDSYLRYGKAFGESIGARRGGNAKLVGNIIHPEAKSGSASLSEKGSATRWDEFALAHYPSILHFADMLASEDYQAVNLEHRVPALRDTCILCTSEIALEEILAGAGLVSKL